MELGQLIFTSMPAKISPIKREGYHAHYWTKAFLSSGEVSEIEKKLIYDVSDSSRPIKKQYFLLQTGRIVVTETCFINGEMGIEIDSFKRTETYFSHCYIVTSSDFLTINNNPFTLFSTLPFYDSLDALKKSGHSLHNQNLSDFHINIPIQADSSFSIENLSPLDLYTLIGHASNAINHLKSKKQLQFLGNREQFEKVLNLIFSFLPTELRLCCTFDTFHDKCNIPLGTFWGVSVQRRTMGDAFIPVEIEAARINTRRIPDDEFANKYYGGWLKKLLEGTKVFKGISTQVATAYYLACLADGVTAARPTIIDHHVVSSFYGMYENEIAQQLSKILRSFVPIHAVGFFQSWILKHSPNPIAIMELLLPGEITPKILASISIEHFSQAKKQLPNEAEIRVFHKLAIDSGNQTLLALCLIWMDKLRELRKLLEIMPLQEYQTLCTLAIQREDAYAADLVVPHKAKNLLALDIQFEDDQDFLEFINAVIRIGETSDLGMLNNRLSNLSRQSLEKLMRAIDGIEHLDPAFTARVSLLYNKSDNK